MERCIDRGTSLPRIDVAVEIELQRDLRNAERLDEVIVESDGICPNCLSSGAVTSATIVPGWRPELRRREWWEIDLRQRSDRQREVAEPSAQHHCDAQK
jgi:hypothetical protein